MAITQQRRYRLKPTVTNNVPCWQMIPNHLFEKGNINVSDDEIRDTIANNQLKMQQDRGTDRDDLFTAGKLDGA